MCLNEVINIDQFIALNIEVTREGEVHIHGDLSNTDKTCPGCGKAATKPHQYYEKRVRHLPMMWKPTYLVFERKDYICGDSECGKVFLERIDFQDLKRQYTKEYEEYIYQKCRHMSITDVMEEEHLSWDIVSGIFKKKPLRKREFSKKKV
jgi:transposase